MVDGDEWKRRDRMDEWNSPENIALDEYTSLIVAHYENVLRPVVQGGKSLDRNAVALVKSDLEWKLQDPNYKDLPFKTKEAYQNFYNFVVALDISSDEEIKACIDVLCGLFKLGINCYSYGNAQKEYYKGRNPCRDDQYKTQLAIRKAGTEGSSKLLDAARQMANTCIRCPYK